MHIFCFQFYTLKRIVATIIPQSHTPPAIPKMPIEAMPCEILLSTELTSHDSLYSPYKQQKSTLICIRKYISNSSILL